MDTNTFRRFLSVGIAVLGLCVGLGLWLDSRYVVPILMYHSVAENSRGLNDTVSPQNFRRQLDFLKRNNYQVLRLSELVDGIQSGKRFSRRSVVLTFDDGRADNFTQAFAILKEKGFPAMFFVSGAQVSRPGFMTWEELTALKQAGMDVGSHGMTEAYLPDLSVAQQRYEIFGSKKILESRLKGPVDFYAYSIGGFSLSIKELVEQAGYRGALATNRGTSRRNDDVYELRRIKMTDKNTSSIIMWFKVSGYYNMFRKPKNPF